jgi:hypothetical protein
MTGTTTLGAIDIEALLALHRATFGGLRMETDEEKAAADAAAAAAAAEADDDTDEARAAAKAAEDALGDPGKKALDAMKVKWQAERTKRTDIEAKLAAALAAKKPADGDDELAQARQKAVDDAIGTAMKKANARILASEIKAAAAGKLANPALALKLLDLSKFEVDDDGNVDAEEISDAIADLIKNEPYLAAQGRKFQGDADAGPRTGAKTAQLSEADVKKMTPEQIVEAQSKGLLADYLAS